MRFREIERTTDHTRAIFVRNAVTLSSKEIQSNTDVRQDSVAPYSGRDQYAVRQNLGLLEPYNPVVASPR